MVAANDIKTNVKCNYGLLTIDILWFIFMLVYRMGLFRHELCERPLSGDRGHRWGSDRLGRVRCVQSGLIANLSGPGIGRTVTSWGIMVGVSGQSPSSWHRSLSQA